MTERIHGEREPILSPVEQAAAYLAKRRAWLTDAVEVVDGRFGESATDVFPAPTEVRADAPDPGYTSEQEAGLREVAGRFGIGGEADVPCGADYEILEGGKPWKIEAELALSTGVKIFAGSDYREIGGDERAYLADRFGNQGDAVRTEYAMARLIAETSVEGFTPLEADLEVPFGYDIQQKHEITEESDGQLVQIGTDGDGKAVYLLRVDRENYRDEATGSMKYRNQPDSAALARFVSGVLDKRQDTASSVGLITSNTYASRAVDLVRTGLAVGRPFVTGMYGRETLANVRRATAAEPTPIAQIPGELHVLATKLDLLEKLILVDLGVDKEWTVQRLHDSGGVVVTDKRMDIDHVIVSPGVSWVSRRGDMVYRGPMDPGMYV